MSKYTYFTDELGTILETHAPINDGSWDPVLTPFRKPMRQMFIDTPDKLEMWNAYWNNIESWWEGERASERRNR